jgi:hypothetical protein
MDERVWVKVQGSEFRVEGSRCRFQGLALTMPKFQRLGFKIQGI